MFVALLCALHAPAFAAEPEGAAPAPEAAAASPVSTRVDLVELQRRINTARALMVYDMVAWVTSDAIMAEPTLASQLGRAWFVLEAEEGYVGVYGRYDAPTDAFVHVASYRMNEDGRSTTRVEAAPPAAETDPRARAIDAVWRRGAPGPMKKLMKFGVNPNQYVLPSADGYEVWLLPSLAQDGRLVTSTCATYETDAEGRRITGKKVEKRPALVHAMGRDAQISLVGVERELPTVCELFWAYYYADDVALLEVRTKAITVSFKDMPEGRMAIVTELP